MTSFFKTNEQTHVFNVKTRTFQTWADWALEACEDKDIKFKQEYISDYMRGAE
ncbi:hypothetical protein [Aeromonas dhakensis]|uniref:hypothetical protein n=1 Tax=Aeromonas dhakensis TaxID=196024 RepID=UPI0038D14D7C